MKQFFTKRKFFTVLGLIVLFSIIGFVEKETSEKEIKNVIINIKDEYGNYFIDEGDIYKLITANYTDSVRGKLYDEIDLKKLEQRVRFNRFVDEVQVYKDHKGNVLVDVVQCRPVMRIARSNAAQFYVSDKGRVLPVTDKFTARVITVEGEGAGKLQDTAFIASDEGKALIHMVLSIEKDPFLKAQVSGISRTRGGELKIFPQIGDEVIEFGKPEDVEQKFRKLKIYYKKIVRLKGYNKYKSVNLKFQDQIVCE